MAVIESHICELNYLIKIFILLYINNMSSNNPNQNVIQRKKNIIIKSSNKEATSDFTSYSSFSNPKNGDWETILNNHIEISNGDTLEIQNAFVDTTKINPNTVKLKKEVYVEWENILYLTNSTHDNVAWSKALNGTQLTDNLPYVFCSYNVKTNSGTPIGQFIKTAQCVSWNQGNTGLKNWGNDYPLTISYMNINGDTVEKVVTTKDGGYKHLHPKDSSVGVYDVNVTIKHGTLSLVHVIPPPIVSGHPFDGWANQTKYPAEVAYIAIPYQNPDVVDVVDSGIFEPVRHKGNFTIPVGEYDPTHLTEIINQNFTIAQKDNLHDKTLRRAGAIYATPILMEVVPATTPITYQNNIIDFSDSYNSGDFSSWYQQTGRNVIGDTKNNFAGWTIQIVSSTYAGPGTAFTYQTITEIITDNEVNDPLHTFRFNNTAIPPIEFLYGAIYPVNGGVRMTITPPLSFQTGSHGACFLQSTENYREFEADGRPKFCFCSVHTPTLLTPSNIINFTTDITKPILFGSNQIDLNWDTDRKRFRFNYLHFPLTAGGTGLEAPAIITQTTTKATLTGGALTYARTLSTGSKNIIASSYGGICFTKLEPKSFFQSILGLNYGDPSLGEKTSDTILLSLDAISDVTLGNFAGGIPSGGVTPTTYTGMVTQQGIIKMGTNATENLVTIADVTGTPLNYQLGLNFAEDTATTNPNGRVLVGQDAVTSINASTTGDGVGSLDSGYYIIEVQASFSNVESVGDNSSFTKNIRIVMNRYYNMDSYTSMAGDGIEYIHYGMPTRLSSVKCRVINADGTNIQDLGQDNTVFLKITKNIEIDLPPIKES